ncbi:MAG: sigma-54-dependent Fis family transcriptional regulator, partial [Deltaproteobacteria bacterium]|nr:sigma-54-dependent Fis family transcriptional regulator [Deltaproteobacteria bacterium]
MAPLSQPISVLVVEDDANLRSAMTALVSREREGNRCSEAASLGAAKTKLETERFDAVLVDLSLPDGSGLELIGYPEALEATEYIVVTGDASAETAVQALRRGALDYLTKPVDRTRLRSVLANVARTRMLKSELHGLRGQLRDLGRFGSMVGRSDAMQKVYELIERVGPTDASVFVTGERKRARSSSRRRSTGSAAGPQKPLLAVNCGAMSPTLIESELFGHEKGAFTGADRRREGYFERANGGTLFLDELTEMPLDLQIKLLRVLEAGRRDAGRGDGGRSRSTSASSRPQSRPDGRRRGRGTSRGPLPLRLNVFPIALPPLGERGAGVALLAEHFLAALNAREDPIKYFTAAALDRLRTRWRFRATSASSRTSWSARPSSRTRRSASTRAERRRCRRSRVPGAVDPAGPVRDVAQRGGAAPHP